MSLGRYFGWGDDELVEEAELIESGLSESDLRYITAFSQWLADNDRLTTKQRQTLIRILERHDERESE